MDNDSLSISVLTACLRVTVLSACLSVFLYKFMGSQCYQRFSLSLKPQVCHHIASHASVTAGKFVIFISSISSFPIHPNSLSLSQILTNKC